MRITTPICVALGAIALCLGPHSYAQAIRFEGASAGSEIAKVATEEFQRARKNAPSFLTGISGSGGALAKLCANTIDIANAERPILKDEVTACRKAAVEFIELPIAFDAVAVVVNPRNKFVQALTAAELRTMWEESAQGKIVRWSQVNAQFPDAPLKLLGPDRKYEQANVFTETILGQGRSPRRDYTASVDEQMLIQGVARDVNTLSYVSYPTYLDNRDRLKVVPVVTGVKAGGGELSLSRPLFLYVNARSLERPLVREFVEFTLANGAPIVKEARYQPLSASAYRLGLAHLRSGVKGSAWDGSVPVGVTPSDVERRLAAL